MRTMIYGSLMVWFFLVTTACNQSGVSGQSGERADVQGKTVEQLEQEVLSAACDETMKKNFEDRIQNQKKIINNDTKLKNSLRNMKNRIKCP